MGFELSDHGSLDASVVLETKEKAVRGRTFFPPDLLRAGINSFTIDSGFGGEVVIVVSPSLSLPPGGSAFTGAGPAFAPMV